MYELHWQLNGRPFENWCDNRFFFPSEIHETALLKLRYSIENRRSAVALCGDSGMGKTMLIDALSRQISEETSPVARIVFPRLSGDQLLGYLADELTGEEFDGHETALQSLRRLEHFFHDNVGEGRHALVVIDEAHLLTNPDQLETLRLLLNFREESLDAESAWTLLLVGDTTLLGLIERNHALDQRMSVKCMLGRFTRDQTASYVDYRLGVVGGSSKSVFTPKAVEALHMLASGIPRRINRLADLAMMVGYAEDLAIIDGSQIEAVYHEIVSVAA